MGAIGEGGLRVLDTDILSRSGVTQVELCQVEERERAILDVRSARIRRGRNRIDLTGRTAIVVDDGIATGSTARAACRVARQLGAARVILAAPVGAHDTVQRISDADEVVCVCTPPQFLAVGNHYRDFSPTSEEEVIALLDAAARRRGNPSAHGARQ